MNDTATKKFLFDTRFGEPGNSSAQALNVKQQSNEEEKQKQQKEQELKAAFDEGFKKGHAQQLTKENQELTDILKRLIELFETEQAKRDEALAAAKKTAADLGKMTAITLVKSLIKEQPEARLDDFFKQVLSLLPDETPICLYLSPGMAKQLKDRDFLTNQMKNIMIKEDESLNKTDARFDWDEGGIAHHFDHSLEQIEQKIDQFIASWKGATSAPALEPNKQDNNLALDEEGHVENG